MAGILMPVARFVWLLAMLLISAPALRAQPAPAVPAPAEPAVLPRIILQTISETGLDVAAWSPDGRLVYSASGLARELLVWDARQGIILDRLRLPAPAGATVELMRLKSMTVSANGTGLTIDGEVFDVQADDRRAARRYAVDLQRRQIAIAAAPPLPPSPAGMTPIDDIMRWVDALSVLHGSGGDSTPAQAQALLPALPPSPDGRSQLVRMKPAFGWRGPDGRVRSPRVREVMGSIGDAELSPDDRLLAILTLNEVPDPSGKGDEITPVEVLDLVTGTLLPRVDARGDYDAVKWLNRERFAILPQDDRDDPRDEAAEGPPSPTLIIDARTGRNVQTVPSLCFMTPLPDGRLLGAGLANCRAKAGRDRAIYLWNGQAWQALAHAALDRGVEVRRLAVSPRGDRFAVLLRLPDGRLTLTLVGLAADSTTLPAVELEADTRISLMGFSLDGSKLWIAGENSLVEWDADKPFDAEEKPVLREFAVASTAPQRMASNGTRLILGGPFEESIQVVDLASGKALRPLAFPGAAAVGYMRSRLVLWAASSTDGIRLWDQRTGAVLMTISLLPGSRYVAVAPNARYDTNAGPDADLFRWVISDQPGRSLPPQTLMRDFYEPRMIAKLLDCNMARTCGTVLHPVPSVATLNRQLPEVSVLAVRPAEPGRVNVDVQALSTRDAQTGAVSGVYGLKLLMNNREIVKTPDDPLADPPADLPAWRAANKAEPNDGPGRWKWTFNVPIPSDGKPIRFSAYSFNADRVKSDTAHLLWQPPPQPPRPRRAYVLTIGVNDYDARHLKLNFAVPDAELIGRRLAAIPGYEVRHISLTSTPQRKVTQGHIASALLILGGMDPDEDKAILRAGGHDGSLLAEATPDDVVIISFSGHGFADASGKFALLASDARWGALDPAPNPQSVLSADVLTLLLGRIQAGEIAMIIDACHSGAAVSEPNFKPGPMGDPGLGQLAFDKGLRILAATQAKDVAQENAMIAHGFLSYALGEGISPTGGPADLDRNGRITLDEWLRYAVKRLPSLNEEVRLGGGPTLTRGVRLVMRSPAEAARAQEPSLFDFTNAESPVQLWRRN